MAKLTLSDLVNLNNPVTAVATINANSALIETALENTLSRDGTSPNTMEANLDMNSNRVINLPLPISNSEPVRKGEFDETIADLILGELDVVDLGSISVITDGGTTARPLDEHTSKVGLTPKDFGATGGGSVNDTTAVQACYAAAISLGLPVLIDDIYLVNAAITINGPVTTYGYDWGISQLWMGSTTLNLFEINTLTAPHFRNIQIVGPNNGTTSLKTAGAFFRVDGDCQFPTWENCRFIFGFNTWNFDEANSWAIDKCFALGHANNGRAVIIDNVGDIGSGEISLSNSLFAGDNTLRTGIGIAHGGGVNVKINNCEFYQWDDGYHFNGTAAGGTGAVYIANSVFSQCTRDVVLTKGSATSFVDLSLTGNQMYGVNPIVQAGTGTPWLFNVTITGNMITAGLDKNDAPGTAGVGVALTSIGTFTMTGNTFTATQGTDRAFTIGADALDGVVANNAYRGSILQGTSSAASGEVYINDFRATGVFNTGATFYAYDATVLPTSDGGASLGAATQAWQNLYLNTLATLNIDNGNWVATHTSGILTVGTGDLRVTTAGTNAASVTTNSGTQTLANKTIALGSNTVSGTKAQFDTAVTDDNFAYLATANTFTALQSITLAGVGARITNTTDTAINVGLEVHSDRATMAANDRIGIGLFMSDTAGNQDEFGRIEALGATVTSASEVGQLRFHVVNAGTLAVRAVLSPTHWSPGTSDSAALGTTSLMWSDIFFASGAVVNFNNGDVTITHAADALSFAGGNNYNFDGALNLTNGTDFWTGINFTGTNASANAGPFFNIFRDSASPAANDQIGAIVFDGRDSGGNSTRYAQIGAVIIDHTDASEDGRLNIQTMSGGTAATHLALERTATATHTALLIWDNDNATLERVTVGAADSAGVGFKVLRIPN